jgi:hypothetical protein
MNGNGKTRTWRMTGLLLALLLPGCGTMRPLAPAAVGPAQAAAVSPLRQSGLAEVTVTEVLVTCSEIVHDRRPVGFHMIGRLPSGGQVTLFFNGFEPVAPGTSDVDVPDDAMIQRLRSVRGQYDLQVGGTQGLPSHQVFTDADRQAMLVAVRRTLKSNPAGRNMLGQSLPIALAFAERTLADPKSSQR